MPVFDVTTPDGRKLRITAPEGATKEQVIARAKEHVAAPSTEPSAPQGSTVGGLAKSLGTGVVRGAEGLAGLPGDVTTALGKGLDWLGAPPRARSIGGPTTSDIIGAETKVTGGLHEPTTTGEKFASSIGEFVPSTALGPEGKLAKLLAAIGGGVGSEAAGQATAGTAAEPIARVVGGAAGGMLPRAGAKAVTPFNIPANRQQSANILASEGVKPTAGDITGSRALKYMENQLGEAPGSGGAYSKTAGKIGDQYTAAVLRKVGENADRATPDVIDRAFKRIGKQFDDLSSRNTAQIDHRYVNDLDQAKKDYDHLFVDPLKAPLVKSVYDRAYNQIAKGLAMPGDVYKAQRSQIDRMRRANSGDPELSHFLGDIKEAMDGLMERSIARNNPQDLGAWKDVRRQYRNILVVQKAATGAGEAAAEGIITPARLRQATVAQDRRGYARGKGDFADLSRAGTHLMSPMPQSGTAPRELAQNIPAALAGATVGTLAGGPLMALPAAAGAAFGPGMTGRALMSPKVQEWLINQYLANAQTPGLSSSAARAVIEEMGRQNERPRITVTPGNQ